MGTCSSSGEKVRIDYVSQILESDIPKNIPPPYTELKGIILQKGIIIKNFINYCEKKRKIKMIRKMIGFLLLMIAIQLQKI